MSRREPQTERERHIANLFAHVGNAAYAAVCPIFEAHEMGTQTPSDDPRRVLSCNGHHAAQEVARRAQVVFLRSLMVQDRDLCVDDPDRFVHADEGWR